MQLLKQKAEEPPLYMMIPVEEVVFKNKSGGPYKKRQIKRTVSSLKSDYRKTSVYRKKPRLTDLKFPEMRGGVLYSKCMCLHRNGLQDACPLTQCQGQPQCLVKPWPICPPGKFVRSRYPRQYPGQNPTILESDVKKY
ncbi:PREDICTED: uncharacterized protein LOC106790683 isoform X1 [Polistes canadensis]|uniref:uncharacterized protein LOC106790683 isoform X1 n=1 Tax=Polistes canadensis TaxID=91411 RepID=UPI00071901C5|nr:PREDICTED: uncharacterized protein LOC106790683 isoform X1 [Polistes canadensis]